MILSRNAPSLGRLGLADFLQRIGGYTDLVSHGIDHFQGVRQLLGLVIVISVPGLLGFLHELGTEAGKELGTVSDTSNRPGPPGADDPRDTVAARVLRHGLIPPVPPRLI